MSVVNHSMDEFSGQPGGDEISCDCDFDLGADHVSEYPLPSNKGGNQFNLYSDFPGLLDKRTRVSVDWLSCTFPFPPSVLVGNEPISSDIALQASLMPAGLFVPTGEVLSNPKGYDTRLGLSYGSIAYHSLLPANKIRLELTGADLRALAAADFDILDWFRWYVDAPGATCTTLDLALDYYRPADPLDVEAAWMDGRVSTPSRRVSSTDSKVRGRDGVISPSGRTCYVGSGASDRFLRVYDKALEQKLPINHDWLRLELRLKSRRADQTARLLAGGDLGSVVRSAILDFCDCPSVGWFNDALQGPLVDVPSVGRKDTDFERWIVDTFAPKILRKYLNLNPGKWRVFDAIAQELVLYCEGSSLPESEREHRRSRLLAARGDVGGGD